MSLLSSARNQKMNDEDRKIILEDSEDLCRPILERLQEYYDSSNYNYKEGVVVDVLAVVTYSSIVAMSEGATNPKRVADGLVEAFIGILNNLLMEKEERWANGEEEDPLKTNDV